MGHGRHNLPAGRCQLSGRAEGAKLFFPEEMPELIEKEAMELWGVR